MKQGLTKAVIGVMAALAMTNAGAADMPPPAGAKPMRMGFVCPLTGPSADIGNSARLGVELAVKEINEVGGFLGRRIEIVARDDKSSPDEGRKAATELVTTQKVDFTVGFCNTGVAMKALDVFQDRRQLLMIPVATGSALTDRYPPASSFIFRMAPSDTIEAALLVDDITKRGFTKVAIFADRTAYGDGGLRDVEGLLAEHRLKPAYVARFDVGAKSLLAQMQEAKAAGAEAIVGYAMGPEFAVMAQSRADAKLNAALYGPWTLSLRSVGEQAPQAVEGAIMAQTIVGDMSNERRLSFIMRLKRHAGAQPIGSLMAAAQSYDAVQMMMRAVFQAKGDVSGEALKRALENPDRQYQGVVTTHEAPFSAQDHDAFTRNMVWLGVWRKGEVRFYRTEDQKRAGFIRRKDSTAWWD